MKIDFFAKSSYIHKKYHVFNEQPPTDSNHSSARAFLDPFSYMSVSNSNSSKTSNNSTLNSISRIIAVIVAKAVIIAVVVAKTIYS
ncbi:hypothetical protein GQX74_006141 [Glossina fuscipes]|nr:hypothetical protein GQX74_006141 [Glossina fuscipes]